MLKTMGLLPSSGKLAGIDRRLFLLSSIYPVILTGIQIPSQVICSAPSDFINISNYYSPFHYIISVMLIAVGTFVIWPGMACLAAPAPVRKIQIFLSVLTAVCGTVNAMFFGNDRGDMSTQLVFDTAHAAPVRTVVFFRHRFCVCRKFPVPGRG